MGQVRPDGEAKLCGARRCGSRCHPSDASAGGASVAVQAGGSCMVLPGGSNVCGLGGGRWLPSARAGWCAAAGLGSVAAADDDDSQGGAAEANLGVLVLVQDQICRILPSESVLPLSGALS